MRKVQCAGVELQAAQMGDEAKQCKIDQLWDAAGSLSLWNNHVSPLYP